MRFHRLSVAAIEGAYFLRYGAAVDSFQEQCMDLGDSLKLDNTTTISFTKYVPAGTNLTFPDNDPTCGQFSQIVSNDLCRVALLVRTSSVSNFSMEAWLPRNWTGRFLSIGNSASSGCIQYGDLAYTAALGFSTVGTNNPGHTGFSEEAFYKNGEAVKDFGYRALHTGVVVGKEVSNQFYDTQYSKSYYLGCSTGGRQGMKEAQSFPEDFDGIVAGAPAVAFNNLTYWTANFFNEFGPTNASTYVTPQAWLTFIHEDILNQCDAIDGAVDGIIEDPLLCDYRPENLLCNTTSTNSTNCLTSAQASAVRAAFSPVYGNGGALIFPAMQPGSEINGFPLVYITGQPFSYAVDWFRFAVYNNSDFDPYSLTIDDADNAYRIDPGDIESWASIAGFRDKGGKLLHYHGQADPIITSDISPQYYDFQSTRLAQPASELDSFYRFFRISGMSHCVGGNGAWMIGQSDMGNATLDPDANVLMAMVRWVEQGIAPDTIQGIKYNDDTAGEGVTIVRKHCRYPYRNIYVGPGLAGEPENWECVLGF